MSNQKIQVRPPLRKHLVSYIVDVVFLIGLTVAYIATFSLDLVPLFRNVTNWSFIAIIVFILLNTAYRTLYTLMFSILVTTVSLEFRKGIFNKTIESVDLHRIKDFTKRQSLVEQILSLATLTINSTDFTTPVIVFRGLSLKDARAIQDFLQTFASDSIVKHYINRPPEESPEHKERNRRITNAMQGAIFQDPDLDKNVVSNIGKPPLLTKDAVLSGKNPGSSPPPLREP